MSLMYEFSCSVMCGLENIERLSHNGRLVYKSKFGHPAVQTQVAIVPHDEQFMRRNSEGTKVGHLLRWLASVLDVRLTELLIIQVNLAIHAMYRLAAPCD